MFPRISDLINYLFGTTINIPVQTYGFMVAMAFLAGAAALYAELKRKEREGLIPPETRTILKGAPATTFDLITNALFGFFLGWKGIGLLLQYELFSQNPQEFILSAEGSFPAGIILGIGMALYLYYRKHRQRLTPPISEEVIVHPYQHTGTILLVAAIFGIIGSKLFDTIEHLDDLMRDPLGTIFSFSGLSFYGGLIVAAFAVVWYTGRHGIRLPMIADAIAPALILAYAVGRIGCQLSGDGCWGVVNPHPMPEWLSFLPEWMWSFTYPHNVLDEGVRMADCGGEHCHVLPYPVYPTPFYETVMGFLIFGFLWMIRKKIHTPGYLFCIYLILNGIERFLIESIRVNKPYELAGIELTQAQFIAIILILLGIFGFRIFRWMNQRVSSPDQTTNL